MEDFFFYLLKSSGILALFWCCFRLFLERETFFPLHRIFLLSGIFTALFFPLWTVTKTVLIDPLPFSITEPTAMASAPLPVSTMDWRIPVAIIYAVGAVFFLGRLVLQLLSLKRLIRMGTAVKTNSITYMETRENTSPFSFFNIIVYNPILHHQEELQTIIAHEKIHVIQRHSMDILLIHIFSAFQWINPFVWLYRKTLSQNLEYLADQGATKEMENPKKYQYLLLKNATVGIAYSSIINPFFTSLIKKRIVMLNKNRSNKHNTWKFSLIVPFLAFFLIAFNTKTVTQIKESPKEQNPVLENSGTSTTKIKFNVNKTSTYSDLKQISGILKSDYNISQSFSDIERNQMGELINISSSLTIPKADKSTTTGTNIFKDKNGIKSFSIYVETDKDKKIVSMGHEAMERNNREGLNTYMQNLKINKASTMANVHGLTDPIYIIDGVEAVASFKLADIDPSDIHSINILKGDEAINKYGGKAKNGVIEITTKAYYKTYGPGKDTTNVVKYKYVKSKNEPLFVIDGDEKDTDFDVGSIPPSSIESMNIVKGEEATKKFGKKGKNGVIEITTKKSGWKIQSNRNTKDSESNTDQNNNTTGSVESIEVLKSEVPTAQPSKWSVSYSINTNDPNDVYDLTPFKKNGMEKAVIFVDGANMGKDYVPTMKYSEIESTATLRPGASTTKKYGKLGKHGVIEITTKKE